MNRQKLIARYKGVQTFLTEGCLFLSLLSIAEESRSKPFDCLDIIEYSRKMGYIDEKNEMSEDGQVSLLRDLTGKRWKRRIMKELPRSVPDEMFIVEKWLNPRTGFTHFRRRFVDTLTNSITVKEGALVAYYGYIYEGD